MCTNKQKSCLVVNTIFNEERQTVASMHFCTFKYFIITFLLLLLHTFTVLFFVRLQYSN